MKLDVKFDEIKYTFPWKKLLNDKTVVYEFCQLACRVDWCLDSNLPMLPGLPTTNILPRLSGIVFPPGGAECAPDCCSNGAGSRRKTADVCKNI